MNIARVFIERPIATTLFAVGIAFAGLVGFKLLPVSPLPRIDFPTIIVQASLPGASPEVMATSVAMPLERQLGRIASVNEMTSISGLGSTRITLQFDLSRNIDGAARDVQAAINAALGQLPPDLPSNPIYRKVNPSDAPVLILGLTSDIHSSGELYDMASTILQQKLSQVEGVGQVIVGGSSLPAVRIELNPTVLNEQNISLAEVNQAISVNNINRPKGQWVDGGRSREIITNDQLYKAKEYKPVIVAYRNGAPVRLSDVGEVTDSVEDLRNAGFTNGKPSVLLIVYKQPGANVIDTVDKVKKFLPFLEASIPEAVQLTIAMDRTTTIRASLKDVELTLLVAIFLVILVVYLFLGNVRAALIPSVAVPLSLLGTFGFMYVFGFSLDNLSLMALTIATGFVVDDAVVVLENISRHIENGSTPLQASIQGTKEVFFTVVSMSSSLVAVFIPILFMGGIVGRLFREFAITLSLAIFVSLIVSLTITPMMCARLLSAKRKSANNAAGNHSKGELLSKIHLVYDKSLRFALDHHSLMLTLTVLTIALTLLLYVVVPKGFFPQQDTGRIIGSMVAQQDMSFQAIKKRLLEYVNIVKADPAVLHVVGTAGGSTGAGGSSGNIYITLKSLEERKLFVDDIIARLRKKTASISGASLYLQASQDLLIGARQGTAQYQYTLSSNSLEELNEWAPKVLTQFLKLHGITDVNSDQRDKGLQSFVTIDRNEASRYGITPFAIDQTLYNAFGQRQVSTLYTQMNQYHIVMEVAPPFWQDPETLNLIYVPSPNNKLVRLSNFAKFSNSSTYLTVNHQGQFPSVTISFNLLPGTSLGEVVDKIEEAMSRIHLPANMIGSFQGTAQAFQASLTTEPYLILAALLAVYIVLGILYESFIHPITILSTLPSAGVGALLALIITGTDLNIIGLIGIILLIGIVKKNAIMMIDFALHLERNNNKSSKEAIYEAALLRVRPILMTTVAALLAAIPLAFGTGVGSELRRPLGLAIIGGLLLSQMLTLYTTPVTYLTLDKWGLWLKQKWNFNFNRYFEPNLKGADKNV